MQTKIVLAFRGIILIQFFATKSIQIFQANAPFYIEVVHLHVLFPITLIHILYS